MIDWKRFATEAEAVGFLKAEKNLTPKQARKYMQDNIPKESYYQDKIIKHIKELIPAAFVWKAAAGAYTRQGIPDVCAVINGRYYGFEVKRPLIGVLSKIQEKTMDQIREAGGKAFVVTYQAELTKILGNEILETATGGKSSRTRQA